MFKQPICRVATHLDEILVFAGLLEAALDGGLDVVAAEGGDLAQDPRDLDAVVQQQPQLALRGPALRVRYQSEHVWKEERNFRQKFG